MSVLEKPIEKAVVRWAKRHGIEVTKLNLMGNRGWPDRCFWLQGGRPALIEFKRPGEQPEKLQQYRIEKLRGLGYYVASFEGSEKAIEWLSWCVEQNRRANLRAMDAKVASQERRPVVAQARVRRIVPRSKSRKN